MLSSLGFFRFSAALRLTISKHLAIVLYVVGKIRSEVFGKELSIAISLLETFSCRGLCPFTGLIVITLFEVSMFIHRSFNASPGSANVSFNVCRNVAIRRLLHAAIS